jgi:hypothetical protein
MLGPTIIVVVDTFPKENRIALLVFLEKRIALCRDRNAIELSLLPCCGVKVVFLDFEDGTRDSAPVIRLGSTSIVPRNLMGLSPSSRPTGTIPKASTIVGIHPVRITDATTSGSEYQSAVSA